MTTKTHSLCTQLLPADTLSLLLLTQTNRVSIILFIFQTWRKLSCIFWLETGHFSHWPRPH